MKTLTRAEAKAQFDELLDAVIAGGEPVIVERDGMQVAVISFDEYRSLQEARDRLDWEIIDRVRERNRDQDPEEIERIVDEEIQAYRRERRAETG